MEASRLERKASSAATWAFGYRVWSESILGPKWSLASCFGTLDSYSAFMGLSVLFCKLGIKASAAWHFHAIECCLKRYTLFQALDMLMKWWVPVRAK